MIECSKYFFIITVLILSGCSTHFTTLHHDNENSLVIYQLPEEQVFQMAHWAIASTFPNRKITVIEGPTRGYSTYFRILLDTYSQQILILPAIGTKQDGEEVKGYYFEVSGSGTTVIGRQKNVDLYAKLNKALSDTEKGVVVTKIKLTKYEADSKIPIEETPHPSQNKKTKSPTELLRELNQLHKEGIISDEEFEAKKKEILQRI